MSVSNKVAHLSNKEHSSIAKVSLCSFVPADVSEVMINYKSKRKEVSDAANNPNNSKPNQIFKNTKQVFKQLQT